MRIITTDRMIVDEPTRDNRRSGNPRRLSGQ
jgi:hypothetical protein